MYRCGGPLPLTDLLEFQLFSWKFWWGLSWCSGGRMTYAELFSHRMTCVPSYECRERELGILHHSSFNRDEILPVKVCSRLSHTGHPQFWVFHQFHRFSYLRSSFDSIFCLRNGPNDIRVLCQWLSPRVCYRMLCLAFRQFYLQTLNT